MKLRDESSFCLFILFAVTVLLLGLMARVLNDGATRSSMYSGFPRASRVDL